MEDQPKSWNPIVGCSAKSPGCTNCYAVPLAARLALAPGAAGVKYEGVTRLVNGKTVWSGRLNFNENALAAPLRWKKPCRIIVNSMGDLFHEILEPALIDRVFDVMRQCPQHQFLVLTKRPEVARSYLRDKMPMPNVLLGVSVEDQKTAQERIPILLALPLWRYWISVEPVLEPVRVDRDWLEKIEWVVIGGEHGPDARPCDLDWLRALAFQCHLARVPLFLNQLGANAHDGKRVRAGRKGEKVEQWPPDLRARLHELREFPD